MWSVYYSFDKCVTKTPSDQKYVTYTLKIIKCFWGKLMSFLKFIFNYIWHTILYTFRCGTYWLDIDTPYVVITPISLVSIWHHTSLLQYYWVYSLGKESLNKRTCHIYKLEDWIYKKMSFPECLGFVQSQTSSQKRLFLVKID